jgi:hypothetical protein
MATTEPFDQINRFLVDLNDCQRVAQVIYQRDVTLDEEFFGRVQKLLLGTNVLSIVVFG